MQNIHSALPQLSLHGEVLSLTESFQFGGILIEFVEGSATRAMAYIIDSKTYNASYDVWTLSGTRVYDLKIQTMYSKTDTTATIASDGEFTMPVTDGRRRNIYKRIRTMELGFCIKEN